jgi:AraC family transcriptional regulator of adaptative response/methylated-DNA-[protein]-cysteine methyltransferase
LSAFLRRYGGLFDEAPSAVEFVRIGWLETPLGPMVAGADSRSLRFLEFHDRTAIDAQLAALARTSGLPMSQGDCPVLDTLKGELEGYFSGRLQSFSVPVAAPGTAFQARVWKALAGIPYGETRTYGELARHIGSPGASRAVGAANGLNRVAIVVPCHRVVNAGGGLGGYAAGLERKRALLELERRFKA